MYVLGDSGIGVPDHDDIRDLAYRLWEATPRTDHNPDSDWKWASEMTFLELSGTLARKLRFHPAACVPLAQQLMAASMCAHEIWKQDRTATGRRVSVCRLEFLLGGIGFRAIGGWLGAAFMRGAKHWPASGDRVRTLALGLWETQGKPNGRADLHWALAERLIRLANRGILRGAESDHDAVRRVLDALGQLIVEEPYEALAILDPSRLLDRVS